MTAPIYPPGPTQTPAPSVNLDLGGLPPIGVKTQASDYGLGALGKRILTGSAALFGLPADVTLDAAIDDFLRMAGPNPGGFAQIQQALALGGFYGTRRPSSGQLKGDLDRNAFIAAARLVAQSAGPDGTGGLNLNDYLTSAATYGQTTGMSAAELANIGPRIHELTNPEAVGSAVDKVYRSLLGRTATPVEKAAYAANFSSAERAYYDQLDALGAQQDRNRAAASSAAQAGAALFGTGVPSTLDARSTAIGRAAAGYDAEGRIQRPLTSGDVGGYGSMIASRYGLTVTSHQRTPEQNVAVGGAPNSDHLTGMAVDLAGDPAKMNALAQWAHANEGPGKLFRWVGWEVAGHYDHVHLSFNADLGAQGRQALGVVGTQAKAGSDPRSERDDFLGALKVVESGGNYDWAKEVSSAGARGAYQFMPGTWLSAARYAGVDPNDHSPGAQDAVAKAAVDRLFGKYHDWHLVAAAWNAGEGAVDRAGRDWTKVVTDADYVSKVMSHFHGTAGTAGGFSGDEAFITRPDLGADLSGYVKEKNPVEYMAYGMNNAFQVLKKAMTQGVTPEPGQVQSVGAL